MRIVLSLTVCLLMALPALADELADSVNLAPPQYRQQLNRRLALAGKNQPELLAALRAAQPEHRESLAVLLANMPERDLTSLRKNLLLANVEHACKARCEMPWGKAVNDELFYNYVLPYASVNENRDDSRKDFYDRFAGLAGKCRTPGEAVALLNSEVFRQFNVRYHPTKRPKPDQSPYESRDAHYASCTGLSILLIDACRAVCIPARMVGIPEWTNKSGNHTWVETWDRQWHPIEANEQGQFDESRFSAMASRIDAKKREHSVYAVSFLPAETSFPMVWKPELHDVPADPVTAFYTDRRLVTFRVLDHRGGKPVPAVVTVRWRGRLLAEDSANGPISFFLPSGITYDVVVRPSSSREHIQHKVPLTAVSPQTIELPINKDLPPPSVLPVPG